MADNGKCPDAARDSVAITVTRLTPDGNTAPAQRTLPVEAAIAIEINGLAYAVMMATPSDLHDYATGFLLAETLITRPEDITAFDSAPISTQAGQEAWILRINVPGLPPERLLERVRTRPGESSCGLCGVESLDQALPVLAQRPAQPLPDSPAIFSALDDLRAHQRLNQATGGAHAAAFCDSEGNIILVREDVGRHNALDKLIGAMALADAGADKGFVLMSSRCSYELVEKAARAGISCLVTISTATSLAVERARLAGLNLIILARPDAALAIGPE